MGELAAAGFVYHSIPPGEDQSTEGAKQMITMMRTAFPDLQITVDDMIAEGGKVVARATATGTHTGEFMGIQPTGKEVVTSFIEIARFSGGKLAEQWEQADMLGMMQQVGAVPGFGE